MRELRLKDSPGLGHICSLHQILTFIVCPLTPIFYIFRLFRAYILPIMTEIVLDSFDHVLLDVVRRNNLTPAREIAKRVGLSESAVLRRLRRLRKTGVIVRDIAVVRPASLGRLLTVIVLVSLVREGLIQIEKFSAVIRSRSEVVNTWYVTGEADFVVVLQLKDMSHYELFTHEVFLSDPNVASFKTMVSMRDVMFHSIPE
jgi:Lrp/AsnC family transcriptional regulator, leucine-responsive regulatory protein